MYHYISLKTRTWWFDIHIHYKVITTIKLLNTSISGHIYTIFFFLLRMPFYSLSWQNPYHLQDSITHHHGRIPWLSLGEGLGTLICILIISHIYICDYLFHYIVVVYTNVCLPSQCHALKMWTIIIISSEHCLSKEKKNARSYISLCSCVILGKLYNLSMSVLIFNL